MLELDVTDEETLSRAAEAVGRETAELQLIINVAGVGYQVAVPVSTLNAIAGPGDEVLYSAHGFLMYAIAAKTAGATPIGASAGVSIVTGGEGSGERY